MARSEFRFYGPLNDFLARRDRQRTVAHEFADRPAVKDALEALGPPHPEVAYVFVDGVPLAFDHALSGGERVAVYPFLADLVPTDAVRASPPYPQDPRFVLDVHLSRLAAYLRLLGYDCAWWENAEDADLAARARDEGRVLLTRDVALLKRSAVVHGAFVRSTAPSGQVHEMVARFELARWARPFTRCLRCNARTEEVAKERILHRLEKRTRRHYDRFRICTGCERVFWRGAHFERLLALVEAVLPRDTERWP